MRALAANGTGILLTTHYLEEADELADQVVVIDHGRTIAAGTLRELKAGIGLDVIEASVADAALLDDVRQILERIAGAEPRLDRPARRNRRPPEARPSLAWPSPVSPKPALSVEEIGLRRPRLDEVFLALTGEPTERSQS